MDIDVEHIDKIIAAGRFQDAYDTACALLDDDPQNPTVQHRALLALVRSGAIERAVDLFDRWNLTLVEPDEDILGLRARLLKEAARNMACPKDRCFLLRESARSYHQAYDLVGGAYLAINAATLYYVIDDHQQAAPLAHIALDLARQHINTTDTSASHNNQSSQRAYYSWATIAEANVLLQQNSKAQEAMAKAVALAPDDLAARATTIRQLDLIAAKEGLTLDWLDAFRAPPVLVYTGHMFGLGDGAADGPTALGPDQCRKLKAEIDAAIDQLRPGFAVGALAAGSDIVCAESLVDRGCALTVVLPCALDSFIASSVEPFGGDWRARFDRLIEQASDIIYCSAMNLPVDSTAARLASETAMGTAIDKALNMATRAVQLAVWDGKTTAMAAGTHFDIARWNRTGHRQVIIDFPDVRRRPNTTVAVAEPLRTAQQAYGRSNKVLVFADIKGFSAIAESDLPLFHEQLWHPLHDTIAGLAEQPEMLNSWGDGLFLVLDELEAGAEAALALKQCFRQVQRRHPFLRALDIRIGVHFGPVWHINDPSTGKPSVSGQAVTLAARIESIALPGYIFVTENFARAIALASQDTYRCEYVSTQKPRGISDHVRIFTLQHTKQPLENFAALISRSPGDEEATISPGQRAG